jgi:hypothetical protein
MSYQVGDIVKFDIDEEWRDGWYLHNEFGKIIDVNPYKVEILSGDERYVMIGDIATILENDSMGVKIKKASKYETEYVKAHTKIEPQYKSKYPYFIMKNAKGDHGMIRYSDYDVYVKEWNEYKQMNWIDDSEISQKI